MAVAITDEALAFELRRAFSGGAVIAASDSAAWLRVVATARLLMQLAPKLESGAGVTQIMSHDGEICGLRQDSTVVRLVWDPETQLSVWQEVAARVPRLELERA